MRSRQIKSLFAAALIATSNPASAQTVSTLDPGGITRLTGDCAAGPGSGSQAIICLKTNGVAFAASATVDTTNAGNISAGVLAAAQGGAGTINGALKANGSGLVSQAACADLSNAGTGCSGTLPVAANPTATIGASAVNGSASTFMRSDAAPALPATLPALSGINLTALNATNLASGTVADGRLSANVPLLNAANSFSLGLTAASLTSTGTLTVNNNAVRLGGNHSTPAWTTAGTSLIQASAFVTDTTSSGTVANVYVNAFKAQTLAASNATTYTNAYANYMEDLVAGTNSTLTNKWALGVDSFHAGTSTPFTISTAGVPSSNGNAGVSCAANTVTLLTEVITNGIVTHC